MNSEHRHELAQNELAEGVDSIVDWIQPYWRAIAGLAILLCAVAFSYGYITSTQRQAQESGWNAFISASASSDTEVWKEISDTYKADPVGVWSQYSVAQAQLIEGCTLMYQDRDGARKELNLAVDGFQAVLAQPTKQLLRERAFWGLAQAQEGLNEPQKAIATYESLAREYPTGALVTPAKERAAELSKPQTQEFLSWFFAQSPPKPQIPGANAPFPSVPFGDLPATPNVTVPNPLGLPTSGDSTPSSDSGSASSSSTPASSTPTSSSPPAEDDVNTVPAPPSE